LIDYLRRCEDTLRENGAKPLGRFRWFSTVPSIRKLDCQKLYVPIFPKNGWITQETSKARAGAAGIRYAGRPSFRDRAESVSDRNILLQGPIRLRT
jgi:hypothetical protein